MEITVSAFKHGIAEADIRHAFDNMVPLTVRL